MTITTPEESSYVVNPSLQVIRSSDDEIVIKFGSRSKTSRRLKDDARRAILGDLVQAFTLPSTIADAHGSMAADPEALQEMTRSLIEQKVVVSEQDAVYSFLTVGMNVENVADLLTKSINLVGTGKIASRLRDQLADIGLTAAVTTDVSAETFEDADLTIVASDTPNMSLFFDANEAALVTDRPWHAVYADGAEIVVGPLFRPGYTGCFHDYDTMDESARSLRLDYLYYKSGLQGAPMVTALPLFAADLAASYAAASIVQHASGRGSFLEGSFLRIDLERLEIIREQLLQMPRCPACIQNKPHLRHPFI